MSHPKRAAVSRATVLTVPAPERQGQLQGQSGTVQGQFTESRNSRDRTTCDGSGDSSDSYTPIVRGARAHDGRVSGTTVQLSPTVPARRRRWRVYRDRLPLPPEELGQVEAADYGQACTVARAQFGRGVLVERAPTAPLNGAEVPANLAYRPARKRGGR